MSLGSLASVDFDVGRGGGATPDVGRIGWADCTLLATGKVVTEVVVRLREEEKAADKEDIEPVTEGTDVETVGVEEVAV